MGLIGVCICVLLLCYVGVLKLLIGIGVDLVVLLFFCLVYVVKFVIVILVRNLFVFIMFGFIMFEMVVDIGVESILSVLFVLRKCVV